MPWQVYVHSAAVHDLSLRLLCKGALPEGKCFARRVPQPPTLQIPIRKGITSSFQRPAREPLELSLLRFYCVMRWNAIARNFYFGLAIGFALLTGSLCSSGISGGCRGPRRWGSGAIATGAQWRALGLPWDFRLEA